VKISFPPIRRLNVRYSVVASFLCLLIASAVDSSGVSAEESPSAVNAETRLIEELYRIDLLPRLQPGETCKMFSSYDRTGGNDDGFSGKYSILRKENGNAVLAEMKGPGCIQRMHFPHSEYGVPGLLGRKHEHVRIYLDGEKRPALDVPLEDIFHGKLEGFPKPLADEALGGHYCYVPIPYKKSCKVVVDGTDVKFVQIVYRTFPGDKGIVNFRNPPTDPQRKALATAARVWSSCGDLSSLGVDNSNKVEKTFALKAGESLEMPLPEGPQMIRAIYLKLRPDQSENANATRLQITWDDAKSPAVDLPLDYFYCRAKQSIPFCSLLVGTTDRGSYNFMPMPYRRSGVIKLSAAKLLEGSLTVVATPLLDDSSDVAYLHAVYNESLPTKTGKYHPYLVRQGRGKFIGTYLATDGQNESKLPTWLEGDEQFTCDGELRIHGTGTEDGFNCGWYAVPGRLNGPGATPLSGFPVYRKDGERNVAVAFRWYLTDPVPYEKSIDAELEHGGVNDVNANYRTAAFFYDAAP
jgi:hypothetical protein